jgi:MazG family protein
MSKKFDELTAVMQRLREPNGCPWDIEQTYASLAPYLLEESYEAFDAIQEATETGNTDHLREELGDVLLQVIFHSQIAKERGDFTIDDVAGEVAEKLILRHPHVFGNEILETASDVLNNWDKLKSDQRKASGQTEKIKESILDDVPVHFPALLEGQKLTKKAAKVGFDWEDVSQIYEKLNEEIDELNVAIGEDSQIHIEEELGDILFVVLNLARKLDVDAETALKKTNRKFRKRFGFIEKELKEKGKTLEESNLEEMESLWTQAKKMKSILPQINTD